ncbi:STAS domain-containing protein [Streptomyces luteolifulvus]|jgi:anti-anti-sigma factor|uniref:STAS domain-containing protein n=1 Tax=Streptomyces luteolifulvus TaxID=2615112 RepID=A0A6H9V5P7_9ACTN|nr:STAS domain-containing protein [Streptomyces luteolifulvus]
MVRQVRKRPPAIRTDVCQVRPVTLIPKPLDRPDRTVLALPADIDFCTAEALFLHVMSVVDTHPGPLRILVLDLTGNRFMDSQGARLIDTVRRGVPPRVRVRVVAAPDGMASRVLELTGLRRDVPVYSDLSEALAF